ncbi:hypothetical protein BKCO1_1000090 [Neofusicoccum parvum]|uniref:Uncharacterized protein n=1 Tax=Neofusicoccum parvum TaxID=310453 RepID=A0ACB5S944_9PEZI|nr:hypothetical protein BKCO1_1000090 [Neofusicoccum parvum]
MLDAAMRPMLTCTNTPPGSLPSLVEFTTPPHTVISDGKTFTSPYLYLSFHSIVASDYYNLIRCGSQPTGAAAMVSINPSTFRSVRHGWNGAAHPFDPNDYAYTSTLGTAIPLVPADAYNGMYRCWDGQAMTAPNGRCATIRDDYEANIPWPLDGDQVFSLDPAWKNCAVDSYMGLFVEGAEEIGRGPKETSAEVTAAP